MVGENLRYYVVADSKIIHRNDKSDFITTFDLLFKVYHVYDVHYPEQLKNFFYFIEKYIYQVPDAKETSAVSSLYINLNNIKVLNV